jgi:hypothetical protein
MILLTAVSFRDRHGWRQSMFFMGGMTMGYLHPKQESRGEKPDDGGLQEQNGALHINRRVMDRQRDDAVERTLIWARRILC